MPLFSMIEIRDITISLLVLCAVFAYPEFTTNPAFLLTSLIAVGVAFMGHELSHKFMAIRHGFWSEYRMWPQGLVMALLITIATNGMFVFAAPGAVYFTGRLMKRPRKKELRNISMAGITFNLILMTVSLALFYYTSLQILSYMAMINAWLAIFNLLPFGGLDGEKLLKVDKRVWAILLIIAISGFLLTGFI